MRQSSSKMSTAGHAISQQPVVTIAPTTTAQSALSAMDVLSVCSVQH
jgi:hypothetical protein